MLVRPILEVPTSSVQLHTNVMTDRAILYQRYLEHYQRQLEDEDEEEEQEQEHVHALDPVSYTHLTLPTNREV